MCLINMQRYFHLFIYIFLFSFLEQCVVAQTLPPIPGLPPVPGTPPVPSVLTVPGATPLPDTPGIVTPQAQVAKAPTTPKAALAEAASPLVPLFTVKMDEQSKFRLYSDHILNTLSDKTDPKFLKSALSGFITDIVDGAIATSQATFANLEEVKATIDSVVKTIVTINNTLKKVTTPQSTATQKQLTTTYTLLVEKTKKLEEKIKQQNILLSKLEETRALSSDNSIVKINSYSALVASFSVTTIDGVKDEFVTDMGRLASAVKGKKEEETLLKNLFNSLIASKQFNKTQTKKITSFKDFLEGKLTAKAPTEISTKVATQVKTGALAKSVKEKATGIATKELKTKTAALSSKDISILSDPKSKYSVLVLAATNVAEYGKTKTLDEKTKNIMREKLVFLYNNRSNKKFKDIDCLAKLFETTKSCKDLSDLATQARIETTGVLRHLCDANETKGMSKKATKLTEAAKALTPNVDKYEIRLFTDALATLVANRKTANIPDAKKEKTAQSLKLVETLFNAIPIADLKSKGILDADTASKLEEWKKVITAAIILLSIPSKGKIQRIKQLEEVAQAIANKTAVAEKQLFVTAFSNLFANRGNLNKDELTALKVFFTLLSTTKELLAANQLAVLTLWLKEIEAALLITTATKIYLEAVLEVASSARDIAKLRLALVLITQETPKKLITTDPKQPKRVSFIKSLNEAFNGRARYNRKELYRFFAQDVATKKVGGLFLLNEDQRRVLNAWVAVLAKESAR
jgi:hypothetical protein